MVKTRAQGRALSNSVQELARRFSISRQTRPNRSPSKVSKEKQKQKSKRESAKFEKLLSTTKKNLSKAAEREMPARPIPPKTLFDIIHEPIVNGEAKRNLRSVPIVIDDD